MAQYVCAFRGRRDAYQVPLALAEAGHLDQFITDFYLTAQGRKLAALMPSHLKKKMFVRFQLGIPDDKINNLFGTTFLEHARHRLGYSPATTLAKLDRRFAYAAARRARESRANLFLYTPYAYEAFVASYRHTPRKILFEFHPHADYQHRLLTEDVEKFSYIKHSYIEETGANLPEPLVRRVRDCWKHADLIVCASSFTKHTLVAAGADPRICEVVPYGIEVSRVKNNLDRQSSEEFKALFVGWGAQRKGLHHLLKAWGQAKLPKNSSLTLVCRYVDPGLMPIIRQTPNVNLIVGTSIEELHKLYNSSTLFVLPSLVEGFGQVYLEALSHGCPVLGTAHTCLPDIGTENDGVFLTKVGDIEALANRLEELSGLTVRNNELRQKARVCAASHSWSDFRAQIKRLL
ncbi:MAG: glycosyltransferase family 4 protein [Pyrinomonadaceae bacterium MAG19_C2-C3]|nr:glycosyltransferase family 4 protein [Pyrinomonadaceae bacterium MAG19_C2-C3]